MLYRNVPEICSGVSAAKINIYKLFLRRLAIYFRSCFLLSVAIFLLLSFWYFFHLKFT